MIVLSYTILGFISLITLLGGISAVTDKASSRDEDFKANIVSMTWVILVYFLIVLILMTIWAFLALRQSGLVIRSSKILLFLLAILIAWMGIEVNKALEQDRTVRLRPCF
jgi:choline-glycine betaine transporter